MTTKHEWLCLLLLQTPSGMWQAIKLNTRGRSVTDRQGFATVGTRRFGDDSYKSLGVLLVGLGY
jgi:hypothetical protein